MAQLYYVQSHRTSSVHFYLLCMDCLGLFTHFGKEFEGKLNHHKLECHIWLLIQTKGQHLFGLVMEEVLGDFG